MDCFLSDGLPSCPSTLKRSTNFIVCCLICFTLLWPAYVSAPDTERIRVKIVRKENLSGFLADLRINGVLRPKEQLIDRLNTTRYLNVANNLRMFQRFQSVELLLKWSTQEGDSVILDVKQAEANVEEQDRRRLRRDYVFEISATSASLSIHPFREYLPVMDETPPLYTRQYNWPNRIPPDGFRDELVVRVERICNEIPNFRCQLFAKDGMTPLSEQYIVHTNQLSTPIVHAPEEIAFVEFVIKKNTLDGIHHKEVHLRLDWNDLESLEPRVLQKFYTYDLGKRLTYRICKGDVWRRSSYITSNFGEERDVGVDYLPQFLALNDIPTADDTENSAVMKLLLKKSRKWFTMTDTAGKVHTGAVRPTNPTQRFVMPENTSPSSLEIHEWRETQANKDGKSDQEIKTQTINVRVGKEGEGCAGRLYILEIYEKWVLVRAYSKLSQTGTREELVKNTIQFGSQN